MSAIFESVMLVCFGLSWPLNVIKAYKAGTTKGTSRYGIPDRPKKWFPSCIPSVLCVR